MSHHDRRPPKPDVFELMVHARRRVFVRVSDDEYLVIIALQRTVSVLRWCKGDPEPINVETVWQSAAALGLHDGQAWDIQALATWISKHCVVCWKPLEGKQMTYCSRKCRQKAYRERRK